MKHLQLGASLYVPCVRDDLLAVASGEKLPFLRSLILCLEDAVRAEQLPQAMANLARVLPQLHAVPTLRFVRVRNPWVLEQVLAMEGAYKLDGYVIPKVTRRNLGDYMGLVGLGGPQQLMLTLETAETFDPREMYKLRDLILESGYQRKILSLRIGGNDLLGVLGLKRQKGVSIYHTPVGQVISTLVGIFKPSGFNLSGAVYDYMYDHVTLKAETHMDLQFGLFGKTAIHPSQIAAIEGCYMVDEDELQMAKALLDAHAPAVWKQGEAMLEPATQQGWAKAILSRAEHYGVRSGKVTTHTS